jgi:nucleotide-binding universal stress UspA family protein
MGTCIVCGIDDSSGAVRAASVAARLARDLSSRALLVHVAEGGRGLPFGLGARRVVRARNMRKKLRSIAEECSFPNGTEVRLERGDPARELLSVADKEDAELMVASSGGTGYASAALVGGVASALMRSCPCPVVVVPPRAIPPLDSEGMQCVVCGLEDKETDIQVVRLAADLASRLGGDLHVVYGYAPEAAKGAVSVVPDPALDEELRDAADGRVALTLAEAGVKAQTHVFPLPAADALEHVADQQRAGLAVAGPPERSGLDSAVGGSIAIRFAADGSTALVVLPAEAELELGSGHYEFVAGPA